MAVVQQRFAGHGLIAGREVVKPVALADHQPGGLEGHEVFAAHVHAATGDLGQFGHGHALAAAEGAQHQPARGMADGGEQQGVVGQRPGRVNFFGDGDGFHAILSENPRFLLI